MYRGRKRQDVYSDIRPTNNGRTIVNNNRDSPNQKQNIFYYITVDLIFYVGEEVSNEIIQEIW